MQKGHTIKSVDPGSIADELGLDVETVRNYFGGDHYDEGKAVGLHIEQGPNGGIVKLDDTTILEKAKEMLEC